MGQSLLSEWRASVVKMVNNFIMCHVKILRYIKIPCIFNILFSKYRLKNYDT
jgi:hypothetical protein